MTLKERITTELKNCGAHNIDKMLDYMDKNGYFTCSCSTHNHWQGGSAEHMWAVYLIAKALRDHRIAEPEIAKYATDQKLALICLLHDLCNMHVTVYSDSGANVSGKHGLKSKCIMDHFGVGTDVERWAVRIHMHKKYDYHFGRNHNKEDECNALYSLIHNADHNAASSAWNSKRFLERKTQHLGTVAEDINYLWAVAMDRSIQSGFNHMYMDENYELREYKRYGSASIKWNAIDPAVINPHNSNDIVALDNRLDVITAAHEYTKRENKKLCIVVGVESGIPKDRSTRLRPYNIDEREILICSNITSSFYSSKKDEEKGKRRYRFEFTMRDEIKKQYKLNPSCIYLPNAKMIRDGRSRGLPFVEPWNVDLLLIPGKEFDMFAIPAETAKSLSIL